jgi:hypothetical protein
MGAWLLAGCCAHIAALLQPHLPLAGLTQLCSAANVSDSARFNLHQQAQQAGRIQLHPRLGRQLGACMLTAKSLPPDLAHKYSTASAAMLTLQCTSVLGQCCCCCWCNSAEVAALCVPCAVEALAGVWLHGQAGAQHINGWLALALQQQCTSLFFELA